MSAVKRERWTEADVDALPPGEHDYFERKSGLLFGGEAALLAKVAKATSAMANSGGGHILLGVEDAGTLDGVPPVHKGRTATRDWLEQVVPMLVNYPLADFRVHVVQPAPASSRVPPGRQVIVIDVGDSALAPHQCMRSGHDAVQHVYYYRQAGHSVPAPHFYLELLRQRLVSPTLEASPHSMRLVKAGAVHGGIFLVLSVRFLVRNVGRVAAYRWALRLVSISGHAAERAEDYRLSRPTYPPMIGGMDSSIRVDPTILPGCTTSEDLEFGVLLRAQPQIPDAFTAEIERLLGSVSIRYQLATETSPGEPQDAAIGPYVEAGTWGSKAHSHVPHM